MKELSSKQHVTAALTGQNLVKNSHKISPLRDLETNLPIAISYRKALPSDTTQRCFLDEVLY